MAVARVSDPATRQMAFASPRAGVIWRPDRAMIESPGTGSRMTMPAEESKAVIRRFYELLEEYGRTGTVDLFDEAASPSVVDHDPGLPPDMADLE